MDAGDTEYLGDGAYVHYTGYSFVFMANSHTKPTDEVHIELNSVPTTIRLMRETLERREAD